MKFFLFDLLIHLECFPEKIGNGKSFWFECFLACEKGSLTSLIFMAEIMFNLGRVLLRGGYRAYGPSGFSWKCAVPGMTQAWKMPDASERYCLFELLPIALIDY